MAGSEAQAGFYYQNLVAALRILDLIEIGTNIRCVSLENPGRAKHIDDIIVDFDGGARFVQVKWSQNETSSFTLANLIAPGEDGDCSLWQKLSKGYLQVHEEPGEICVELLSTRRAGENRQPAQGFKRSLSEFIGEFHDALRLSHESETVEDVPYYSEYEDISVFKKEVGNIGVRLDQQLERYFRVRTLQPSGNCYKARSQRLRRAMCERRRTGRLGR